MMMNGMLRIAALAFVMATTASQADSILVDTTADELNDDGDCSLREAIESANSNTSVDDCNVGDPGLDSITLGVTGTIQLNSHLEVTEALGITGFGPDNLTIVASGGRRHFIVSMPDNTHDFTISGMTLTGGAPASGDGGSLLVNQVGTMRLDDIRASNNLSTGSGGALALVLPSDNQSRLEIHDSLFRDNISDGRGGAVYIYGDNLVWRGVETLDVQRSAFHNNLAHEHGGAIDTQGAKRIFVTESVFNGNVAGNGSSLPYKGGGISWQHGMGSSRLQVERSTFTSNLSSGSGGAIATFYGTSIIRNSTFHDNLELSGDGGQALLVSAGSESYLFHSTLTRHIDERGDSQAIRVRLGSSLSLSHNIVWANDNTTGSDCIADETSTIISNGYNIDSSGTCTSHATDLPFTDPDLAPLGDYGDEAAGIILRTRLPFPEGSAADGGDVECPELFGVATSIDQRGEPRLSDSDGDGFPACDIGAVEYQQGSDPAAYSLALSSTGPGHFSVDPIFEQCPADCTATYLSGTDVVVTAIPSSTQAELVQWTGDCAGTSVDVATCTITMDRDRSVGVQFEYITFNLTVTVEGSGTVVSNIAGIDCPNDCSESYIAFADVLLTATPAAGYSFAGWSGDCSGTTSCLVTMNEARSVEAVFDVSADEIFGDRFEQLP